MHINVKQKTATNFVCKKCNFSCSKKSNYDNHLFTAKHKKQINGIQMVYNDTTQISFECNCGKSYKYKSGFYRHKKSCSYINQNLNINDKDDININNDEKKEDYKELFMKLIIKNQEIINDNHEIKNIMINSNKENQELRKYIIEQSKQITDMIPLIGNNNNNTNNVKNKFNINVFLNEKCKDAISIDQFIDTIEVSIKNLLTTRDKGLGEGLSSIIIDNMNKLSLYERPMHCTDKKRETMYIKNQEWIKDNKLEQIDQMLKKVENKQIKNIEKWTDANPNFMDSEKLQEEYMRLIKGCTSSINDCRGKTIKKVCHEVYIEKE